MHFPVHNKRNWHDRELNVWLKRQDRAISVRIILETSIVPAQQTSLLNLFLFLFFLQKKWQLRLLCHGPNLAEANDDGKKRSES